MYKCEHCQEGYVQIDTDSFVTNVATERDTAVEMRAEVKGYCSNCSAEHTFSIEGSADVSVKL